MSLQPKLPELELPSASVLPAIPFVGSVGAQATTYIGEQFGNLPDLQSLASLNVTIKSLQEVLFVLLKGQLGDIPRGIAFAAQYAAIAQQVAQLIAMKDSIIGQAKGAATEALGAIAEKEIEIATRQSEADSTPISARTPAQERMSTHYAEFLAELSKQANQVQAAMGTLK